VFSFFCRTSRLCWPRPCGVSTSRWFCVLLCRHRSDAFTPEKGLGVDTGDSVAVEYQHCTIKTSMKPLIPIPSKPEHSVPNGPFALVMLLTVGIRYIHDRQPSARAVSGEPNGGRPRGWVQCIGIDGHLPPPDQQAGHAHVKYRAKTQPGHRANGKQRSCTNPELRSSVRCRYRFPCTELLILPRLPFAGKHPG
jgi:hypothetical protein